MVFRDYKYLSIIYKWAIYAYYLRLKLVYNYYRLLGRLIGSREHSIVGNYPRIELVVE